jgi:predicted Rossmann fold nucleotide-binding protein DprA/Smf involved in DNA uptake
VLIGWTGTRTLRKRDLWIVRAAVASFVPRSVQFVTGGCVGVDAEVARLATTFGVYVHTIIPWDRSRVDPEWSAFCDSHELMPEGSSYADRNRRIVAMSDLLVGVAQHPEGHIGSRRSGTWQTLRIARRAGVPTRVIILREEVP